MHLTKIKVYVLAIKSETDFIRITCWLNAAQGRFRDTAFQRRCWRWCCSETDSVDRFYIWRSCSSWSSFSHALTLQPFCCSKAICFFSVPSIQLRVCRGLFSPNWSSRPFMEASLPMLNFFFFSIRDFLRKTWDFEFNRCAAFQANVNA